MDFPDLPHLLQLQKDLWQWPNSRAAVMVGAGFSRNSVPTPGVKHALPLITPLVGSKQVVSDEDRTVQPTSEREGTAHLF